MSLEFTFEELAKPTTKLIPNAIYRGKTPIRYGSRPLDALFKGVVDENGNNEQRALGTAGGIRSRFCGVSGEDGALGYIVIRNNKTGDIYKNSYNSQTKVLTYYGDNNVIKQDPLSSKPRGNRNLMWQFEYSYGRRDDQLKNICPIFYFESVTPNSEEQEFVGIAYPYVKGKEIEEVMKIEETHSGIKNYKFQFTIVSEIVSKNWIYDLLLGEKSSKYAPRSWREYLNTVKLKKIYQRKGFVREADYKYTISENHINLNNRVAQNELRQELIKLRKKCEVCEVENPNLLIASHILPWEKHDAEAGEFDDLMLLCANHNLLLDKKLITFSPKDGKIKISNEIKKDEYKLLNIDSDICIEMSQQRKEKFKNHNILFQK